MRPALGDAIRIVSLETALPTTKIIVPTGHLGTTPFETASFENGVAAKPDYVIADSGSCDIGPYPLGSDVPPSSERWQRHDLEHMLLASRKLGVPMIIGSASDTGTDRGVDQFVRVIHEIAAKHKLAPFRLATIHSEVPKEEIRRRMKAGAKVDGLGGRSEATMETIDKTDRIVAVMGDEPLRAALRSGVDLIIAGRSCDTALFAAPLLERGHSRADAYLAGKALECASFCAEPFAGKETVMGTVKDDGVYLTAMKPEQRCTPISVAAHAMYERANPFREFVPGGYLDMTNCKYEQTDEKTTRITGQTFVHDPVYRIKLEGSGKVAERRIFIVGVRDPYTIKNFDQVMALSKARVEKHFGPIGKGYNVHYHCYGRNAIIDALPAESPVEIGIVADVTAPDGDLASDICVLAAKALFMVRLPETKGTAGTAAIFSNEVIKLQPAYEWTMNHVIAVDKPDEFFTTRHVTVGA